jgi:hypothetical protein
MRFRALWWQGFCVRTPAIRSAPEEHFGQVAGQPPYVCFGGGSGCCTASTWLCFYNTGVPVRTL